MRFKSLKYRGKEHTEHAVIERKIIDSGNAWLLDCEVEEVELEIFKNRLSWNTGRFYNGVWVDGDWKDGDWFHGLWMNGRWHEGHWRSGTWNDGIWEDGQFDGGAVVRGIFKNRRRSE